MRPRFYAMELETGQAADGSAGWAWGVRAQVGSRKTECRVPLPSLRLVADPISLMSDLC